MSIRKITVSLAAVAIVVIAGIFLLRGFHEAPPDSSRLISISLRLKWVYDPGFAGEMVASKAGLFEKYGVRVDIKPGGFEADPIKLVAAGSDTIGVAGADLFLIAR